MALQQLPLNLRLRDDYSYASYIARGNEQVLAALRSSEPDPLLYLWGVPGSGKTHLLHAATQAMLDAQGAAALLSLTEDRPDARICQGLEQCRLIGIDGVDALQADHGWQTALFHLLNRAQESGARIILTARAAPQGLTQLFADLRSRLSAGLIFEVNELVDDDKITALQQRARMRGFVLGDEVARYLLHHSQRDSHSLFALLDRLDQSSLTSQRRLTVPFVKQVLSEDADQQVR